MTTIKIKKSPVPALAAALLVACGVMIVSFLIIGLLAPFGNPDITPSHFWRTVWDEGFLRYCGPRLQAFNLDCRTANLRAWLAWPPFYLRFCLVLGGTMIAASLAAIWSWKHTSPRETIRTIRGAWPLFGVEGRASLRKAIAVTGTPQPDSLWLAPHIQLTPVAEAANILVIGDQGSGKSAVIRGWAEQVLARGERSIIHDAKGDVLACAPIDKILLVAPHDARGWSWDIGRDVTNAQGAREVAEKLVPSGSELESMWSNGARAILSGAIEALQRERKTDWRWADLFQFVFKSPKELRASLEAARAPSAHLIEIDDDGAANRTTLSLILTLWVAALTTIRPLAQAEAANKERRFSVYDWLSEPSELPRTIILQHNAEYPLLSTAISGLLVDIVCGKLLSPSAPKRDRPWLHLILDELPVLGRLEQFPKLLNVGREKGAAAIVATQDWDQILKLYQQHDAATLEARFKIKVVCRLGISETRERVVGKYAGRRAIETWVVARKGKPEKVRHEREIDVIEPNYLDDELGVRTVDGFLVVRALVFGLGNPVIVEMPFTQWCSRREAYTAAAWARTIA
ncbi:MAG: type IV secretion system DNA-binding domain-containing protein [Burkholderia sp.]|uniref:type IV secretion system DNA-binding domain-containing protein n=1 Tax=Bradyrhizobium sp. TaxID=376 RepID=UPI0025BECE7B|nr:type IV secretion system DNA-binding domain-containing protein [Bradyrhizobium sp.]MCA3581739.1 type IV secretion system DNA-binding domain-containing protein [Bradyrhizobium sp.]MCA3798323.1 type IV secretion system DNA-binding domain-containing protein [Burkholderia sp.]